MKKLLNLFTALPLVAILMFSSLVFADTGDIVVEGKPVTGKIEVGGGTLELPNSDTLPGTCAVGDTYVLTSTFSGQQCYVCESTNVWVSQGSFYSAAYYPDYNEADQGVTGNGKSAKAYIDAISTNSATLVFRHSSGAATTTTYTFSTDETIPSNINVVIEKGAILSIDNTFTLTINSTHDWGLDQVFSGAGTIAGITWWRPEWRGCTAGGNVTTNATALAKLMTEMGDGVLHFGQGTYSYDGAGLTYSGWGIIEGEGWVSKLDYQGTGIALTISDNIGAGQKDVLLRDFWLTRSVGAATGGLLVGGGSQYGIVNADHIYISGFTETNAYALRIRKVVSSRFTNSSFAYSYYGVRTTDEVDAWPTTITFDNCRIRSNTKHGVLLEGGMNITFTNETVLESNYGSGIRIATNAIANLQGIRIEQCHFENNQRDAVAGDYSLTIVGQVVKPIVNLIIQDNYFNDTTTGNIYFIYVRRLAVYRNTFSATCTNAGGLSDYIEWKENNGGTQNIAAYGNENYDIDRSRSRGVQLLGDLTNVARYSTHQLIGSCHYESLAGDGSTTTNIANMIDNTTGNIGGGMVWVSGWNTAKNKRFVDVLLVTYGVFTVLHTWDAVGVPAARTYTVTGNLALNVQFANDADTYNARVSQLTN